MREFRSGSSRVLITTDLLVSMRFSVIFWDGDVGGTKYKMPSDFDLMLKPKMLKFCDRPEVTKQLELLGDQGSFSTMGSSYVGICYL